jgi:hypothetical protein
MRDISVDYSIQGGLIPNPIETPKILQQNRAGFANAILHGAAGSRIPGTPTAVTPSRATTSQQENVNIVPGQAYEMRTPTNMRGGVTILGLATGFQKPGAAYDCHQARVTMPYGQKPWIGDRPSVSPAGPSQYDRITYYQGS